MLYYGIFLLHKNYIKRLHFLVIFSTYDMI